jgi:hypothetical protein
VHYEACVEVKQDLEGVGTIGCMRKDLDGFTVRGVYIFIITSRDILVISQDNIFTRCGLC